MQKQTGFAHIFLILFLLAGLAVGVYLVQQKTNILPKASEGEPTAPETSIILSTPKLSFSSSDELINVTVNVRTDVAAANLVKVRLNFDKDSLAVDKIIQYDVSDTLEHNTPLVFKSWVENNFDNSAGTVSLVVGMSNPGYQTKVGDPPLGLAHIIFKSLKPGSYTINIADDSSILSNADNINILTKKLGVSFTTTADRLATGLPSAPPAVSGMPGIPQIPHRLYGNVTVNGAAANAGVVVSAKINGQEIIKMPTDTSGRYGYGSPEFQIPGENRGATVQLYVGNEAAQTTIVENGKVEQLNLSVPVSATPLPAVPQLPHSLYGTVTIRGSIAGAGVTVSAKVRGVQVGSATTDSEGYYGRVGLAPKLVIQQGSTGTPLRDGDLIQLYVGNEAAQTTTYKSGGVDRLDLSVPVSANPIPTATSVPSPVPTAVTKVSTAPSSAPQADCARTKADINGDGNVDLTDLSKYYSHSVDVFPDGQINTKDYSCMIKFLIQSKVIKG